jgi:hypothetical protein
MAVFGNDEPDATVAERGSGKADVEVHAPQPLPLVRDGLQLRATREPIASVKAIVAAG